MLAFAAQYPDVQRDFPIVIFRDLMNNYRHHNHYPCLSSGEKGRELCLVPDLKKWGGEYRFLALFER
jgi:hypothetical protein